MLQNKLENILTISIAMKFELKDGNTPRALISKSKEDKEPQVHIYNN